MQNRKICLAMIVKNEAQVIERCLSSVKNIIDYWVIVDTGSTDGTQDLITKTMEAYEIPGELHEKEWVNFEVNRNQSLDLAKGKAEYTLVIDADDFLIAPNPSIFRTLSDHAYKVEIKLGDKTYHRIQIFKSNLDWEYEGILHEYLKIPKIEKYQEGILDGVTMIASSSACQGDPKYLEDAQILEKELKRKDLSANLRNRYMFYIAQSYFDGKDYKKAIEYFQKRGKAGGWPEEVYVSLWMAAKSKYLNSSSNSQILESFVKAWEYRPQRKEATYDLINFLSSVGKKRLAFLISKDSLNQPPLADSLCVDKSIYEWKFINQYATLCYQNGYISEGLMALEKLTESSIFVTLSEKEQKSVWANLELHQLTLMCSFEVPSGYVN
jgi:glycosyltransferase involved in cell wall biosynthesis